MQLFFDFLAQNWVLASVWTALILAFYFYEASKAGKSVGTQGLSDLLNRENAIVLDIRDNNDFKKGHIVGAKNIPQRELADRLSELNNDKENPIVVVCKLGQASTGVTKTLRSEGFSAVYKLSGGMTEWVAANLPVTKS